jgi:hypothetical protein
MSLMAIGSTSGKVSGLVTTFVVASSLTWIRYDTLGESMTLNMDSIDLFANDFLFAFITPFPVIVLPSLIDRRLPVVQRVHARRAGLIRCS